MHAAIVIPCLNEEASLEPTCASLGFGLGSAASPIGATLILVDNGSTDQTAAVMRTICHAAPDNVILAAEPERGYVPPRHHGALVARNMAIRLGLRTNEVVILQADADTIYDGGYVEAMRKAAETTPGALVEGVAHTLPSFLTAHPGYHRLAEMTDRVSHHFAVEEADEIVIDDQVAGYRLSDYFAWGGHRREYGRLGDEIHAETSRLFLRGKMKGAKRVRVAEALAYPSRRKVELDPLLHFATEGFPREAGWCKWWRATQGGPYGFDDFERPDASERFAEAMFVRQAHSLILFSLLPAYVASQFGRTGGHGVLFSPLSDLMAQLAHISSADLASDPGRLFEACFPLIESHREIFETCLKGIAAASPESAGNVFNR